MYTIGEFSRITMLTVKALRYYDAQGLLKPSARAENGYRLYTEGDFQRARLVGLLRRLDFGIAEIRDVLEHSEEEEDLQFYLAEKREQLLHRIQREKELMREMEQYLHPTRTKAVEPMTYEMQMQEIPPLRAMALRFDGTFADIGKHTGSLFREIRGNAAGPLFCLYHDAEIREVAAIDLCIQVQKPIESKNLRVLQLPRIQALCTTHTGSYETLNLAYKALMDWAKKRDIKLLLPWREIYRRGPGMLFRGNPDRYQTEIQVPCEV